MAWEPLPPGRFGARADHPGVDANLVWADATDLRDFRRPVDPLLDRIPVIVELKAHCTVEELATDLRRHDGGELPPIYLGTAGRYCTAHFTAGYCRRVCAGDAEDLIARFELQLPVVPQRPRVVTPADAGRPAPRPVCGSVGLLGIIDSGCPFAHRSLRDACDPPRPKTRVLALWTQDAGPAFLVGGQGVAPAGFGYGVQATRSRLDAAMRDAAPDGVKVDEAACYAAVGYAALRRRFLHGAAVSDLLAGPLPLGSRIALRPGERPAWQAPADEPAVDADLVCVDLPADAVQDSSSAGLPRLLLDGLRYIVGCAGEKTRSIVVNISDGSSRGSHDGESIFERAVTALVQEQAAASPRRRLEVVLPAGNSFDEERHARIDGLDAGGRCRLTLRVPPGSEAPAYVLVRIPRAAKTVSIRVVAPGSMEADAQPVETGQAMGWPSSASPQCGVVFPAAPQDDDIYPTVALIAIAPTTVDGVSLAPRAPCGDWHVLIGSDEAVPSTTPIDLYIARNQTNPGALRRGLQARFVDTRPDAPYDPQRHLRSAEDDRTPPACEIRRHGSLSSLACARVGNGVTVVESRRLQDGKPSRYSSAGPTAAAASPRQVPDAFGIGDLSRALRGINAAGSLGGSIVRVTGTSFAAPQVARRIFNVLAHAADPAPPDDDFYRSDTTGPVRLNDPRT